jgi:hypothetical protein
MKLIVRSSLALVLLVLLALGGAYLYRDQIARAAVERGMASATETAVTVQAADVALGDGRLQLDELQLPNPAMPGEGRFQSPFFSKVGQATVKLATSTLMSSTVHVKELKLSELTLHLERKNDTSNHAILRQRLRRKRSETGTRLAVERLVVENVTVTLHGYPGGKRTFELPVAIELKNLGTDGEAGLSVGKVTGRIFDAIDRQIRREAGGGPNGWLNAVESFGDSLMNKTNDIFQRSSPDTESSDDEPKQQ